MRKIHYIYVCLGMLLLSVLPAKAAPEAEYGKVSKTYTLHADGSQEMRARKELTLFTHTAMNGLYGETFITYNPAYQTLKINDSYTRQKDGTLIKNPENAFVEVLPASAADAPAYNGLREMVVVHTGLDLGATLYLDYSITTRAGYLPELDICEQVQEYSPIKEYTLTIVIPGDKKLQYKTDANGSLTVKKEHGNTAYNWTFKHLPAISQERANSAASGGISTIIASTYPTPAEALGVLQSQFTAAGEPEVVALAQKLVVNKSTAEEKTKALNAYLNGLGTCKVALVECGYRIRPASEVIRTAYGTEAEKANLLSGLMKAAGLPADVKVAYLCELGEDTPNLSGIRSVFLSNPAMADMQDFMTVLTLDGKKAVLEAESHRIDRKDTLSADGGKVLAHGYKLLTMPAIGEGFARYGFAMESAERETNLLLPYKADETYTCEMNIPSDAEVCTPQKNKVLENSIGKVAVTMNIADGKARVTRSLQLKKQLITPKEYADFHRLMSEWADANNATLLLKQK